MPETSPGARFVWALFGRLVRAGGQIVFTLMLARAVGPAGFAAASIGLIGHQIVVTLASQTFTQAVIRYESVDAGIMSTAFWLNLGFSLVATLVVAIAAVPTALVLHLPELVWLLPCLAIAGVATAPTILGQARLTSALNFESIARIEAGATVLAIVAGLLAIWCGYGIVSVLAYAGVQRGWELIGFLRIGGLPKRAFDHKAMRALLKFSLPLAVMEILVFVNNFLDQIFVGAFGDTRLLGYFGLARRLTQQPTQMIAFSLDRTMFPALLVAGRLHGGERKAELYLAAVQNAVLLAGLPFLMFAAMAGDVILLAVGSDWAGSVPFVVLFALASALQPVGGVFSAALRAEGDTQLQLGFVCLRLLLLAGALALVVGLGGGVWELAVATALIGAFSVVPVGIASARKLGISPGRLAGRCGLGLLPSLLASGAAFGCASMTHGSPLMRLGAEAGTGMVVWIGLVLLLFPQMRLWRKAKRRLAQGYG